jgi:hypothetical protein
MANSQKLHQTLEFRAKLSPARCKMLAGDKLNNQHINL